jgi:hypothetical protein
MWFSDTDQTSEADEIHCELVTAPGSSAVRKALQLLSRGVP